MSDYYQWAKSSRRYFSYRYFSNKAGIKSPNFLKMVIEGKRNLTPSTIAKFITALVLKEKEGLFFKHLVLFNQAKASAQKQEHYLVMVNLAGQIRQKILGSESFEYFENWYTPVIREFICLPEFDGNLNKLARRLRPPIRPAQAGKAVELLVKLGFVAKTGPHAYRQTDAALATDTVVSSMAVRNFNRKMIQLAEASLDGVPVHQRSASGVTLGISEEGFKVLEQEISAFKDRIVNIVNSYDKIDQVYQLNVQLFPLSRASDTEAECKP